MLIDVIIYLNDIIIDMKIKLYHRWLSMMNDDNIQCKLFILSYQTRDKWWNK